MIGFLKLHKSPFIYPKFTSSLMQFSHKCPIIGASALQLFKAFNLISFSVQSGSFEIVLRSGVRGGFKIGDMRRNNCANNDKTTKLLERIKSGTQNHI